MTEKVVVHVTNFEQWKKVLRIWFDKGYTWKGRREDHRFYDELYTRLEPRYLYLYDTAGIKFSINLKPGTTALSYEDFMERNKEQKDLPVYLTQEQADRIASGESVEVSFKMESVTYNGLGEIEKATLGETERVTLKVKKEPLYRLWRIDNDGDKIWFDFYDNDFPEWNANKEKAFTAPLEEIEKWKTPAWTVEPVGPNKQGE